MARTEDEETLADLYDMLSDSEAQFGAEVAMFGDAWPGAYDELTRLRGAIEELSGPEPESPSADSMDVDADELPF